jgi:uncharacterized protein YecE (DUF72 family)
MRSADYLAFYAEHFHTVEVDSTFYACPSARTVGNWASRTPEGFIFSVKVQDRSWMPSPSELKFDPITADWTYIRWLGDRKGIEEQTTTWDKTVVDRTSELRSWVDYCDQIRKRGVMIYAYANNHFAGHAPATIEQFRTLWHAKGLPQIDKRQRVRVEASLFPM